MLFCFCLMSIQALRAQCNPPSLLEVTHRGTASLDIEWVYFGFADQYELDLKVISDNTPPEPRYTTASKKYSWSNLNAGQAYSIYLRAKCSENTVSDWTIIETSTAIQNPSTCGIELPIKNNNCNRPHQEILINVTDVDGSLGTDVFLERVDIIATHSWPSDLKLELQSPSGQKTLLSRHNGIGTQNIGIPSDTSCDKSLKFSDLACSDIDDARPPLTGEYRPEESLRSLEDGTPANGVWKLILCDRSIPDIGSLNYIALNFSELKCPLPQDFKITDIDATTISLQWEHFDACNVVEMRLKPVDGGEDDIIRYSVDCTQEQFTITDLSPDTQYEFSFLSDCFSSSSPSSCPMEITTLCAPSSITSDFDNEELCSTSCTEACQLSGIWQNSTNDDLDWSVWSATTPTESTGPRGDALSSGNYIYLESSPDVCGSFANSKLETSCLEIPEDQCGISFYYHMHGNDMGSLMLVAESFENIRDTLWSKSGNQEDTWQFAHISLDNYALSSIKLNFIGTIGNGAQGDMALDEIKLHGAISILGGYSYYQDLDADGYGNDAVVIQRCSKAIPEGYTTQSGDCDDNNNEIHPGADEIGCNGIDENCNGPTDDRNEDDPLRITAVVQDASCAESADGSIDLSVAGGSPPYVFEWLDGNTSEDREGIKPGIYQVQVSDGTGCVSKSEFIQVQAITNLNIFIQKVDRPSCNTINNGRIQIIANGGKRPYTYAWDSGHTGSSIENLGEQTYICRVTDNSGCSTLSDSIHLIAKRPVKLVLSEIKQPKCSDSEDGKLTVQNIGNTPVVSWQWLENNASTQSISMLRTGDYTVVGIDSMGCSDTLHHTLSAPDSLISVITAIEHNLCYGEQQGSIITNTTGGTAPYTFLWDTGYASDDLFNLRSGSYSLTVKDANLCTASLNGIRIIEPPELSYSITENISTECILSTEGRLKIEINGGVPPYRYHWQDRVDSTQMLSDITAGIYSATIIDANDCKLKAENIEVISKDIPLEIETTYDDNNRCHGDSLSTISVLVKDPEFPVDYNWSNGIQRMKNVALDTIFKLPSGNYGLTVTDKKGCVGSIDAIELLDHTPILTSFDIKDNVCVEDHKGSIELNEISGGHPPYKYKWSTGSTNPRIKDLATGYYYIDVIDSVACIKTIDSLEVRGLTTFEVVAEIVPSGSNDNAGEIHITNINVPQPYTIRWLGITVDDTLHLTNLSMGNYIMEVTTANGCTQLYEYNVPQTDAILDDTVTPLISAYPNPSTDNVSIESAIKIERYKIVDMSGKVLVEKILPQSSKEVSIPKMPGGIYQVILYSDKGVFSLKQIFL